MIQMRCTNGRKEVVSIDDESRDSLVTGQFSLILGLMASRMYLQRRFDILGLLYIHFQR